MDAKLIWLIVAVAVIVVFFYFVLPRLNLGDKSGKIFRAILFLAGIAFLAYDFIQKEHYKYLIVLGFGAIGFFWMLFSAKKK